MFIIGLVYLVRADKDLRGKSVASYTSAISHWQQDATGATSFFNAFGSASGLWLNVTLAVRARLASPHVFSPADQRACSQGGNQFPSMFSVPMTFGSQQVAISDTGADAAKCAPARVQTPLRQRRESARRSRALTAADARRRAGRTRRSTT